MRPPPKPRASTLREMTQSPADSIRPPSTSLMRNQKSPGALSNVGTKRKEREYENDARGEETNINVVVRCRGRSEREVKENSGVVVSTEGAKGKTLELSMGPNAVSNKTYHFDKVFSPAADQGVVYEDVVTPILNEVGIPLVKSVFEGNTDCNRRCCQVLTAPYLRTGRRGQGRLTPCRAT